MKDVTLWYRYDQKTYSYKFNHLEWGHNNDPKPTPLPDAPAQKDWEESRWLKELEKANKDNKVTYGS